MAGCVGIEGLQNLVKVVRWIATGSVHMGPERTMSCRVRGAWRAMYVDGRTIRAGGSGLWVRCSTSTADLEDVHQVTSRSHTRHGISLEVTDPAMTGNRYRAGLELWRANRSARSDRSPLHAQGARGSLTRSTTAPVPPSAAPTRWPTGPPGGSMVTGAPDAGRGQAGRFPGEVTISAICRSVTLRSGEAVLSRSKARSAVNW